MGLSSKAWRFVRGVWLLATVVLCIGAFLCFLPTELDVSTALTPAHSPPLERGVDEGYLAVFQQEAWEVDKDPVHADLLTMLLLVVFFGLSFGWVLSNSQRQGALLCSSLGLVGPSMAGACEELPFLGVFRL
jgi:hypothetical protein